MVWEEGRTRRNTKPENDQEEGTRQREAETARGNQAELLLSVSNSLILGSGWAVGG